MPGIDNLYPLVPATLKDGIDLASAQSEKTLDPLLLENPDNQITSADLTH